MSASPATEASQLLSLMDALGTAHIFEAAADLGLITQLTSGPKDAAELAQACATDPSITALLLDTLADLGVVHGNRSGRYRLGVGGPALMATAAHGGAKLANVVRS
jgi:DNA-binding IclR family transcriptional regulator